ncbi:hypothetical protein G6F37_010761 [Rhizopus arrhizus]|nr:hypothetical protein G6F38_010696 [Rhizopus arrhizus]KAG1152705.1 hypothetical protein G6F37_010761 [Rhizopus arrhizus]
MLLQHQIVKWHDHTKSQPLRYLGFPVIQSLAQLNTLILSKLWYCLRVVSLPKHFFKQIRSIIYRFIMKGIKPGFQYALLCQPIIKGGLGLLNPLIQYRCLQFRWLQQLFQDDDSVSCSQLPLLALFSDIPSDHWLLSHSRSKLQANQFFTYDQSLHRVRPLLRPDSPTYPRLSGRLVRDLQNRTVTLNKMIWNLILNNYPDPGSADDFPFVSWLTRSVDWISFHPQDYRQTQSDILLTYSLSTLPPLKWKQFWSLKILPEARAIWFRFIYNKLHCNASISRFDSTVPTTCSLCHDPLEDINHLLIHCPLKWSA